MTAVAFAVAPAAEAAVIPVPARVSAGRVPVLTFGADREFPLAAAVTLVGRGTGVDLRLTDPTVCLVHAELIRRGPHLYVCDAGMSRNGTCVNGELVTARLLADGDVLSFGATRAQVSGAGTAVPPAAPIGGTVQLTDRELTVLIELCGPALRAEPFLIPPSNQAIAAVLHVTPDAIKQHLFQLHRKFAVPPGPDRRTALANAVIATGMLHRQLCLAAYRWTPTPAVPPSLTRPTPRPASRTRPAAASTAPSRPVAGPARPAAGTPAPAQPTRRPTAAPSSSSIYDVLMGNSVPRQASRQTPATSGR